MFSDDLTVNAMFFFFGEWAFAVLYLLLARSPGSPIVMPALVWAPLAAAITALFGVATLMVLRPILRPVNG